jgi:hypothetical protein
MLLALCAANAACMDRAARVVIMTDASLRSNKKISSLLDTRVQAAVIAVATLAMMCAPATLQPTHHAHDAQYCMSFEPFELWIALLLFITVPYSFAMRK